jgi:subtilisin family serine protease
MTRDVLVPGPGEPGLAPDRVTAVPGLLDAALRVEPGRVWVRTLVRLGAGGEAALREAGAAIGTRAGDVVTARVPLDAIPLLLSEPGIRAMEAATPLAPLGTPGPVTGGARPGEAVAVADNDSATSDAGFDPLRRRVDAAWEGLAGQGVIIGVYDSGLDLRHEDFLAPSGATRVLFAWDQTDSLASGPGAVGAHLFDYGAECTGPAIDGGSCAMVDRVGHGTHVTGTAAADGSATGRDRPAWRFPGGAPAAGLIVVKGGDGVYTSDRLVDGVAYIFARAEALGRPAVVNISLSSQSGPHDGTTLVETALDNLSGPGRVIVAGAGNAGDHRNTRPLAVANGPNHAQGSQAGSHRLRIPAYQPRAGEANDGVLLELWYDGADSLSITVTTPRGEALTVATGDTASLLTSGGAVAIQNALDGPSPTNGDHGALIGVLDGDETAPPDSGLWQIDIAPDAIHEGGVYHLWITGTTLDAGSLVVLEGGTTNRYLVGVPATGDRIIAAGAHVTRHRWTGVVGGVQAFPVQEELGDIAYFSSPGPRRDGGQKPDLTAPGKVLISALSRDATLWDDFPWLVEADSVHVGLLGTSMAAPQVAAAVAVLLQVEPSLTPEQARDALRMSATADAQVASPLPHPVWGSGKLDAAAAAEWLRPDGLGGSEEAINLSANPVRGDALVINYRERPRSIAVYTLVAERVRTFAEQELGPLSAVWPLDTDAGGQVANGVYVLVVELPGERVMRKLFVARP